MAAYARALADAAGWSPEQSDLLELAAPMHDMGKIGIPITSSEARPLTEEEWIIMRSHPRIGYEILGRSDGPIFAWRRRCPAPPREMGRLRLSAGRDRRGSPRRRGSWPSPTSLTP